MEPPFFDGKSSICSCTAGVSSIWIYHSLVSISALNQLRGALALWLFDSSRRELPDGYEANDPWLPGPVAVDGGRSWMVIDYELGCEL